MNVEEFREYCLSLPGVSEKMPFPNVADRCIIIIVVQARLEA